MDHYTKKLIVKGLVAPAVIAIIITTAFFVLLRPLSDKVPFVKQSIAFSEYEKADVIDAEKVVPEADGSVSRHKIPTFSSNTCIGSVDNGDTSLPLIFDADEVKMIDCLSISADSNLAGDTGCAVISCTKNNSQFIRKLKSGNKISISTVYGDFVYEVLSADKYASVRDIKKHTEGTGKAIIIYTNYGTGYGISNEYYAIICKMVSGTTITE